MAKEDGVIPREPSIDYGIWWDRVDADMRPVPPPAKYQRRMDAYELGYTGKPGSFLERDLANAYERGRQDAADMRTIAKTKTRDKGAQSTHTTHEFNHRSPRVVRVLAGGGRAT